MPKQLFAPRPRCRFDEAWDPSDVAELARLIATHRDELAAVIVEPIAQGAGGMWFYHPEYLRAVRRLCDAHEVLGFYPDSADTFTKIHTGSKECPCPSASVTALNTSTSWSNWSAGRSRAAGRSPWRSGSNRPC
ncbi:aminotransferase class III-fold pyridoxal phosphate-dependent enzyme [Pseudomonas aeruginosa]|uniref:aminotransferase class III-fold pyridoxal phosphate-dependent enzyme n=1 Tax=Pseudomonas aeruginosa TaxID=287 RepID=UPI001F17DDB2